MATKTNSLKFKLFINAPVTEAYAAFTSASALCEWLCNVAEADAHPGGRLYLWWDSGYYTSGEYLVLEPCEKIVFSWHGRGEPGISRVKASFKPEGEGAWISLSHSNLGGNKTWSKAYKEIEKGWKIALENLKSVLETGQDLRFVRRPLLGITGLEEVNQELASRHGLPVDSGILIQGVVDGLGAQAAGLQKGDVLVKFAGRDLTNYSSLVNSLSAFRAGDQVKVIFFRDGERKNVKLTLSQRPLPEIPSTAEGLSGAARTIFAEVNADLRKRLEGASEQMAEFQQSPEEWSVKQILAHLIGSERETLSWFSGMIEGQDADFAFHVNLPNRVSATVAAYPSISILLEELERNQSETVALLASLPADFVARKRSYWRMAYNVIQTPPHYQDHALQIEAALAAARAHMSLEG
jgi:uncharacterized protein YndB with AHSA1/START domain